MPKNLTNDASTFPTQTAPLAGEPRTAGGVETPFQNAANRTAWLKDRVDNIDPSREGVRRLRRFVSIAALRASVDYPDKTIAQVDGVGVYQFDAASTATAAEPFVVTPTAIGGGAGRWIWSSFGALNVANGIPQLDGSGKVPAARLGVCDSGGRIAGGTVHNGIVSVTYAITSPTDGGSFIAIPNAATDVLVPGSEMIVDAEVGDLLFVDYECQLNINASTEFIRLRVDITKPGAVVDAGVSGVYAWTGSGTYTVKRCTQRRIFSVGTAGSHTVAIYARGNASNVASNSAGPIIASVLLVRP